MATSEFPVILSDRAAEALRQVLRENTSIPGNVSVRVSLEAGKPSLNLVEKIDRSLELVGESLGFTIVVPVSDAAALQGYVIDFISRGEQSGFTLRDPLSYYSRASDPGQFLLSDDKLRQLHPELYSTNPGFFGKLMGRTPTPVLQELRDNLADHLNRGDSRAAVVVSVRPLIVAAYTDELDCVALLQFPEQFVLQHRLEIGSRLLTVNMYWRSKDGAYAPDLVPGPNDTGQFTHFSPQIADFLVTDSHRLERRKQAIAEEEWARATEMGQQLWRSNVRPRDGRPLHSGG